MDTSPSPHAHRRACIPKKAVTPPSRTSLVGIGLRELPKEGWDESQLTPMIRRPPRPSTKVCEGKFGFRPMKFGYLLKKDYCMIIMQSAWICFLFKTFGLKFIYSEKATTFCKISTLLLSYVVPVKSKVEISQNFVAFSEYMNFTIHFDRFAALITHV